MAAGAGPSGLAPSPAPAGAFELRLRVGGGAGLVVVHDRGRDRPHGVAGWLAGSPECHRDLLVALAAGARSAIGGAA